MMLHVRRGFGPVQPTGNTPDLHNDRPNTDHIQGPGTGTWTLLQSVLAIHRNALVEPVNCPIPVSSLNTQSRIRGRLHSEYGFYWEWSDVWSMWFKIT